MMTGLNCRVAVAAEDDIEALIGRAEHARERRLRGGLRGRGGGRGRGAEVTELRESADDAPVIKLVYSVLAQAVGEGASDIHFEPDEGEMRVRFRIDGVLHEAARVPKRMVSGVVSRVKIMSEHGHRREARSPGRPGERQRRRPQDRPARDDAADPARRGVHDPHPRQGPGAAHASTSSAWTGEAAGALRGRLHQALRRGPGHRPDRLGQVDDPLRGAPGAERRGAATSSRSRTRSSTGSRASTSSTSTARRDSTSRPACARSCAPTPT